MVVAAVAVVAGRTLRLTLGCVLRKGASQALVSLRVWPFMRPDTGPWTQMAFNRPDGEAMAAAEKAAAAQGASVVTFITKTVRQREAQ